MYNGPASSSLRHHLFRETRSARLREKFGPAVEHKRLSKRRQFFFSPEPLRVVAQLSNNSPRVPRSGNAATLHPRRRFKWSKGLQARRIRDSRSPEPSGAESTTRNGSPRALVCELHGTRDSAAMMKRGGAEVAPAHLKRVRRTPQWGGSRRFQAPSQGGRALPCLVKMFQHQRHAYCFQQCCRVHWARHSMHGSSGPDCGLLDVVRTSFGRYLAV